MKRDLTLKKWTCLILIKIKKILNKKNVENHFPITFKQMKISQRYIVIINTIRQKQNVIINFFCRIHN